MKMSLTVPSRRMVKVAVARMLREARGQGSMLAWFQFCEMRRIMAATYAGMSRRSRRRPESETAGHRS